MHNLTHVEAQRVMAVLEETTGTVDLVTWIVPDLFDLQASSTDLGEDHPVFDPEFQSALQTLHGFQSQYETLNRMKPEMKTSPDKTKWKDFQSELKECGRSLRSATRVLLRLLQADPDILESVKPYIRERAASALVFVNTLAELRQLTRNRLVTTVEEEKSRLDFLSDVITRERRANADLKRLRRELEDAQGERQRMVGEKESEIAQLEGEVGEIKRSTAEVTRNLQRTWHRAETDTVKAFQHKERVLNSEMTGMDSQLESATVEHATEEQTLTLQRNKMEHHVAAVIQKYDTDVEALAIEIEESTSKYDQQHEELGSLIKEYELLDKERRGMVRAHRRVQVRQEKVDSQYLRLAMAATVIQAHWRGYVTRKQLKKKKKKKTKKKKKPKSSTTRRR